MSRRSVVSLSLSLSLFALVACSAGSDADEPQLDSDLRGADAGAGAGDTGTGADEEDAPSTECGEVATNVVRAIEALNGVDATVTKVVQVGGFSDAETIRVSIVRDSSSPREDSYLVSTESLGGAPCFVYGLQVKSEQIDLTDDGGSQGDASTECAAAAREATLTVEHTNGHEISISGTERADGFSDQETVRVHFTRDGGEPDSYLVNTESLGGAPCLVYGIQLKSEAISLLDEQ